MKKIAVFAVLCAFLSGIAYAEAGPSEQDYKNLDELRVKLMRMRREMDKFMKDVISSDPSKGNITSGDFGREIMVDVTENDKNITVKADLPGMDKDKIEVTLENSKMLKIAGTRDVAKTESAPGVVRQERMYGRFERMLELPAQCKSEGIKASYKNGVLEIVIPKLKEKKEEPVKVSIQ